MNNTGCNLFEEFPVELKFSFFDELNKMGFKRLDDPLKDGPSIYTGVLYDYDTDSYTHVTIEKDEHSLPLGQFSSYITIYKGDRSSQKCIYRGLPPQSSIAYKIFMASLFPSKDYVDKYEDLILSREYERANQVNFDMEVELAQLGFTSVDKSRECLFVRGDISFYYASSNGDYFDEEGHPTNVVVEKNGKIIYNGNEPKNKRELLSILSKCGIGVNV